MLLAGASLNNLLKIARTQSRCREGKMNHKDGLRGDWRMVPSGVRLPVAGFMKEGEEDDDKEG